MSRLRTQARAGRPPRLSRTRLDRMVEEATIDAYGEAEQLVAFYTMIDDHLALPFTTQVLGIDVTVERVDLTDADEIIAVCKRGRRKQAIPVLALPLPVPLPEGWEWIEAYRHWARAGR